MTVSDFNDLEQIIEPVVNSFDCELWGIDYRPFEQSALLRVFIDKAEGVTLDDCSGVSYQLSGVLDVEDPIQVPYTLEVSSPGIERPLLRPEHYRKYTGEKVKLRLKWPVEARRNYIGVIHSADEEKVVLMADDREIEIPLEAVSRGRLLMAVNTTGKGVRR